MRHGRGFAGVVVARDEQHAAVARAAGEVGVLEHVAAAIHAGPLAVPVGEHAVVFRAAQQRHLLRAPDRRWPRVPRLRRAGRRCGSPRAARAPPHLDIDAAERRAAIAGDVAGRVQPGRDGPAARCSSGSRTSACVPVRYTRSISVSVLVVERNRRVLHSACPTCNDPPPTRWPPTRRQQRAGCLRDHASHHLGFRTAMLPDEARFRDFV